MQSDPPSSLKHTWSCNSINSLCSLLADSNPQMEAADRSRPAPRLLPQHNHHPDWEHSLCCQPGAQAAADSREARPDKPPAAVPEDSLVLGAVPRGNSTVFPADRLLADEGRAHKYPALASDLHSRVLYSDRRTALWPAGNQAVERGRQVRRLEAALAQRSDLPHGLEVGSMRERRLKVTKRAWYDLHS